MKAKVEREKIVQFKFESKMPDVGTYKQTFRFKRKRNSLDASVITVKAALTGGIPPINKGEANFIDTIAHLQVYVEPINERGDKIEGDWIDEIFDQEILFAIFKDWLMYQDSFYPPEQRMVKNEEAAGDKPPLQG